MDSVADIRECRGEIKQVSAKIDDLNKQINDCTDFVEKNKLQDEKKQLQVEENLLLNILLKLLPQQAVSVPTTSSVVGVKRELFPIESPSKADTLLDKKLMIVSKGKPLSVPCDIENPFALYAGGQELVALKTLKEGSYHPLLTQYMPSGNTAEPRLNWGDIRTLEYLYPNACRDNSIFDLPLKAQPVIFSKVAYGERNVPYVAEVKSIGAGVTYYSEMGLYGMAAMIESFFPTDEKRSKQRFYESPPIAFALTGAAYMVHIMLIEWMGKLRVVPWSNPFFLASQQHMEAVERINNLTSSTEFRQRYSNYEDVETDTAWASKSDDYSYFFRGNSFWKLIQAKAEAVNDTLFSVYKLYSSLVDRPDSLVKADLLFGQFTVAVRMDRVGTREATALECELMVVRVQLAKAIVFLARNGLIYTDLRPPNIRVTDPTDTGTNMLVYLVDYDDMDIVTPILSYSDFIAAIKQLGTMCTYTDFEELLDVIKDEYTSFEN